MEINFYLLHKMGWNKYHLFHGLGISSKSLYKEKWINEIEFFFNDTQKSQIYCILAKQNVNKSYNFVIRKYSISKNLVKFSNQLMIEFSSNLELLKIIQKYEACTEDYQRHFRINKILKK